MKLFLGSRNPVKMNAARLACGNHWPDLEVVGFDVPSQIAAQPMSDSETRQGAQNRARAAQAAGLAAHADEQEQLGVGMEGGVFTDEQGVLWSTVWVCVIDRDGNLYEANGGRIPVPTLIAEGIRQGGEMGPVMSKLTGEENVKHKQGMFGVITNNFVTRTDEYAAIAQMALGQWYGRDWASALHKTE